MTNKCHRYLEVILLTWIRKEKVAKTDKDPSDNENSTRILPPSDAIMMQKRRGTAASVLPVTQSDLLQQRQPGKPKQRRSKGASDPSSTAANNVWGLCKLMAGIMATACAVVILQRHVMVDDTIHGMQLHQGLLQESFLGEDDTASRRLALPLKDFPSLKYPMQNSKLVGIYFGASWCPMTTPVSALIDQHFGDLLLAPPASPDAMQLPQRYEGLSIVYISSDQSANDMNAYVKSNWMFAPFETRERAYIKRHFFTCAKREQHELGIERKHEIPTLIIVEGESQQVLTYHGVKDLKEFGAQAIDHWLELASLSDALHSKYRG